MLILRRRTGESLVIGENVRITVIDSSDGAVRLAIDAPKHIPILRSELLQAADANRDAANEQVRPEELLSLLGQPPTQAAAPDGGHGGESGSV